MDIVDSLSTGDVDIGLMSVLGCWQHIPVCTFIFNHDIFKNTL